MNLRHFAAGASLCLGLLASARAHGQACCGRLELPTSGTERGGNGAGQLLLGLGYEYQFMNDGLLTEGYGFERANAHTWTLDASFGLTSWLTPALVVPYGTRSYETKIAGGSVGRRTHGFGDALALLKVMLMGRGALAPGALRAWIGGGVKLPTGSWGDDDRVGRLPPSSQMGSGSYDAVVAGYAATGLTGGDSRLLLFTSALYRRTGRNPQNYRFGSDLATSADVFYAGIENVSLRLGARWRTADPDRQDGLVLDHSGGWQLFGRVGGAWYFRPDASLSVDVYLPAATGLRGDQLDPKLVLTTAVVLTPRF